MRVEAANNFLIPNGTFIAELFAFVLILFVFQRWIVPRLQTAMTQRQQMIKTQIEEAEDAKKRLEAAEADYKKALAEGRNEAQQLREDAREQGKHIIEEMKTQARVEYDRIIERGHQQLATERDSLVRELRADVGRLSVELASRIVGESLADEAKRKGTVERFIEQIEVVEGRLQAADGDAAATSDAEADGGSRAPEPTGQRG